MAYDAIDEPPQFIGPTHQPDRRNRVSRRSFAASMTLMAPVGGSDHAGCNGLTGRRDLTRDGADFPPRNVTASPRAAGLRRVPARWPGGATPRRPARGDHRAGPQRLLPLPRRRLRRRDREGRARLRRLVSGLPGGLGTTPSRLPSRRRPRAAERRDLRPARARVVRHAGRTVLPQSGTVPKEPRQRDCPTSRRRARPWSSESAALAPKSAGTEQVR